MAKTPDIEVQIGRFDERIKALDQKVEAGFRDLRDNILNRLDRIDSGKLSASDFVTYKIELAGELVDRKKAQEEINFDKENRLRFLEKYLWMALGIVALIQFVGFAYLMSLFNKMNGQ